MIESTVVQSALTGPVGGPEPVCLGLGDVFGRQRATLSPERDLNRSVHAQVFEFEQLGFSPGPSAAVPDGTGFWEEGIDGLVRLSTSSRR